MCKKSLLMMLLLALLAPWAAMAQTLTVCDGTETNEYIPVYGYYADTQGCNSEFIIPSSELTAMNGKDITAMTFYLQQSAAAAWGATFQVYMKEVSGTTLDGLNGPDGCTIVFTGTLDGTGSTMSVEFNGNYSYHGGNLLIGTYVTSAGSWKRAYFYGIEATEAAYYDDGSWSSGVQNFLPKTTFTYEAPAATPKPSGLAVSNVTDNSAILNWNENGTATSWQICVNNDEANLITANTHPYTLNNLTALTTYTVKVRSIGSPNSDWTNPLTFNTTATAVAVGDAWSDDFEGASCTWDLINGDLEDAWVWGTATNNGGTHALYISDDGGTTCNYSHNYVKVLAAKLLSFTDGKFTFSYDWNCYGESTYDFLRVALVPASQTLTAGSDYSTISTSSLPSGWIALDGGGKLNQVQEWQNKEVAVNVAAGNYYLVLAWRSDSSTQNQPPAAVDNVSITKMACGYDVTALAVTEGSITTTSAAITWAAGEPGQWQVAIKEGSDEWDIFPTAVSSNAYTLTGLTPATNYQVKVRAYCGGEDFGAWCNPVSFATECAVIPAVGYAENFDSSTAGSGNLPICWSRINTGTSYNTYPYVYNYNSNSTPNCLYFYTYGSASSTSIADQYAILPQMEGLDGQQITLFARGYNANSTFKIGVMADPEDVSTFSEIATQALTTSYQEFIYQVTGRGEYIAIMMPKPTGTSSATYGVYIDNISIAEPPQCPKPTGLAIVNNSINGHGATFQWTSEADAWDFAYKKTNDEEFTVITTGVTNPYAITGLAPETAYTVKVRANCGSGVYSDWSTTTSFTTAVACFAPTGLAATLTPGNGNVATLSWTSDASAWVIAYKTADETDFTEIAVTENPYTFDRLEAETTYTAKVKANCGDEDGESQWSSTITFTPTNAYTLTVNDGTDTHSYVPFYGYYADSDANSQFIIPADGLSAMTWGTIEKLTFYTSTGTAAWNGAVFDIYFSEVDYSAFETAALIDWSELSVKVYTGTVSVENNKMELTLTTPYNYMGGNLLIGFDETSNSSNYPSAPWYGVTQTNNTAVYKYSSNSAVLAKFLPKVAFGYTPGEEPACVWPTNLAVNYEGGITATVTWNGEATSYNIEVNGTVTEGVTSPYTIQGLELATTYTVKVQAVCGEGNLSEWTNPVSFTTDLCLPENMCELTFVLNDSYGDGWTGSVINVIDVATGSVIAAMAANNHSVSNTPTSDTKTLNVCDGRELQFVWVNGGSSWDSEASYVVTDINGEEIFSGSGAMSEPVNYTVSCTVSSCRKPTDLAADAVLGHSVILNWTENGEATEWIVAYSTNGVDFREERANAKPFTLEGLEPETGYTVKVRPVCDVDDKWSDEITFTTDVACAAPAVAVETTATTAIVTITGDAETYNLRYRTPRGFHYNFEQTEAWTITDFSPCTLYDGDGGPTWGIDGYSFTNVNYVGSVIAFSDNAHYPAHSGNTMGAFFDAQTDYAPNDDYFITPELTIARGDHFSFWARSLNDTYGLERIKVGVYGGNGTITSYLAGSADDEGYVEVPVDWTQYDYDLSDYVGQTIQLTINCVSNDAFVLFIDDIFVGNPTDDTWDYTFNRVTSPYDLQDLDAETEYELQVQAVCGEGVTSEWSLTTSFTTLPLCQVPTDLAVNDITNQSAVVSWTSGAASFDIDVNGIVTEDVTSPYDLGRLDPGTSYTIRVRAKCDATTFSAWTSAVSFLTLCTSFDLPYEFGFNNDDIYCWTMESANSNNSFGVLNATNNGIETVDGDDYVFLFSSYNNASSYDQILISPELNTEESVKVEFYYRSYQGNGSETFVVGYSTTTNDSDAFTWGEEIATNTTEWTLFRERFPAGTKYVAIYYYANYQYYFLVDAISISEALPVQTIELTEGWNWISLYVTNDDPVDMLDMLKASLGDNVEEIQSYDYSTEYEGDGEWFGDLDDEGMYNEQMYMIKAVADCTIEVEGIPANISEYEIEINPGWNWIGFPSAEAIDVADAMADFEAEEGDEIQSKDDSSEFDGEEWFGDLETFEPGVGLMYFSASEDSKTLVFSTAKKASHKAIYNVGSLKKVNAKIVGFLNCKSIDGTPMMK